MLFLKDSIGSPNALVTLLTFDALHCIPPLIIQSVFAQRSIKARLVNPNYLILIHLFGDALETKVTRSKSSPISIKRLAVDFL